MPGKMGDLTAAARSGFLSGQVQGYRWEAYVAQGPVSYGLNPQSLYKGQGRIVRLTLLAPVAHGRLWRKVAAYNRGWRFGRKAHLSILVRVVAAIEAH